MAKAFQWVAFFGSLLVPLCSTAQDYPNRPITLVVGFTAGGGADVIGRIIAAEMSRVLGQQVIVDNRPGAGGVIGAEFVARSLPNGYTIFIGGPGPNAIAHSLYAKVPYDSVKDFAPIGMVSENPNVLVVHPSVPANNAGELIGLARQNPGKYTYASAGNGSSQHLAGALFISMAHVDLLHVPYKGVAESITGVLANDVNSAFIPLANAITLARAGKVKVLGVTTPKRSAALPDVPTIAESGLPGYEQTVWNALFAPAGTPPGIVAKLNAAARASVTSADVKQKLESAGVAPSSSSPEELTAFLKVEIDKWGKVIRESGAKAD